MIKEKLEQSPLYYSDQACMLIEAMQDNFPLEEFEEWVTSRLTVGGGHIIDFLKEKQTLDALKVEAQKIEVEPVEVKEEPKVEISEEEKAELHEAEKYFSVGAVPLAPVEEEPIQEESNLES